jgi:hypothetical protein
MNKMTYILDQSNVEKKFALEKSKIRLLFSLITLLCVLRNSFKLGREG